MCVRLCMDFYSSGPCALSQPPFLSADVSTSLTAAPASLFSVSGNCILAAGTQKHNGNNTCQERARQREGRGRGGRNAPPPPLHNSISVSHSGTAPISRRHNEDGGLLLGFFVHDASPHMMFQSTDAFVLGSVASCRGGGSSSSCCGKPPTISSESSPIRRAKARLHWPLSFSSPGSRRRHDRAS